MCATGSSGRKERRSAIDAPGELEECGYLFSEAVDPRDSHVPRDHARGLRDHALRPGRAVERQIMRARWRRWRVARAAAPVGSVCRCRRTRSTRFAATGFDKPVLVRYAQWLWKVLHLDLGSSPLSGSGLGRHQVTVPDLDLSGFDGFLLGYWSALGVMKAVRLIQGSTSSAASWSSSAIPCRAGRSAPPARLVRWRRASEHLSAWRFRPDNWASELREKISRSSITCFFRPLPMVSSFATLTILT